MKKIFTKLLIAVFLLTAFISANAQNIRYVKEAATGTGDGSTWENASGDLQAMIDYAGVNEVWVAAGTYLPTVGYPDNTNPRYVSFKLKSGVHIYGGFDGTDNVQTITGRNLTTNKTILSGDIGTVNTHTDNALHVMLAVNLTTLTKIDGLTITRAQANLGSLTTTIEGFSLPGTIGAGIFIRNSKLSLSSVNVIDNFSSSAGCGINMQVTSELTLDKCIFQNNRLTFTGNSGAAILASGQGQKISINGCQFIENRNEGDNAANSNNGGAISFTGATGTLSNLEITNTKFIKNYTSNRGGAFHLATNLAVVKLENLEFDNNTTRLTSLINDKDAYYGGAIYVGAGVDMQSIKNLTFTDNKSGQSGGALYIYQSTGSPNMENLLFYNNTSIDGGAIYLDNSIANIIGATFYKNTATANGGAVYYNSGSARISKISNSLFIGNTGGTSTANLRTGSGTFDVYNSAFNGTGTGTDKGSVVTDVVETDIFKSVTATDEANFLRLKEVATNPAVDKGLNTVVTTTTDLGGGERTINATALAEATVDLGAYEIQLTTLPVTLIGFTVKANGNSSVLNWATGSEINNSYFIVERSNDGKTFEQLTKQSSKGNGGAIYTHTDFSPLNGTNYYRLSQVDIDGTTKILGVQIVKHTLVGASVNIYPNPIVNNQITLSFNEPGFTSIELIDTFGKVLFTKKISEKTTETTLDVTSLVKGIYYVRLIGSNQSVVKKIIK